MTTTDQTVPDAAVQIVQGVLDADPYYDSDAPAIAFALHQRGWLHDPARVAALEALATAVQSARADGTLRCPASVRSALYAVLDALPAGDGAR